MEEFEWKSPPRLAKDILDLELESLLERLEKLPLVQNEEVDEWREKERKKEKIRSWKKRVKESGVPLHFYNMLCSGRIDKGRTIPEMRTARSGCLFFSSTQKGKTFSACSLLSKQLWNGKTGFYLKAYELEKNLADFRPDRSLLSKALDASLLIVDDMEGMRMNSRSSSDFIAFLKKRNDCCFSTILISRKRTFFLEQIEEACS